MNSQDYAYSHLNTPTFYTQSVLYLAWIGHIHAIWLRVPIIASLVARKATSELQGTACSGTRDCELADKIMLQ